jgi:hypothetical protein
MTSFSEEQKTKLEELGGLGMPLRHALLAVGIHDTDLNQAMNNQVACEAHRKGALRLAKDLTTALSKEALGGNVSAARLLMNRQNKDPESPSKWQDDLARTRVATFVDVLSSVDALFARQKALIEAADAENRAND